MFKRLTALLRSGSDRETSSSPEDTLRLATAALLAEAASLDGQFDQVEREAIATLLEQRFELTAEEVESLLKEGHQASENAIELYGFTRVIKDSHSHEERVRMIEMLWEVAYADGHLDDYEANLLRRVAGLIHVSDRESGEVRKRVLARLGLADA